MADPAAPTDSAAGNAGAQPPAPAAPAAAPAAVDVQAEVQKALSAQAAEHARQLKELTGHDSLKAFQEAELKKQGKTQELLDAKSKEADVYRSRFEASAIRAEVLGAASDALDTETVLALLGSKAEVAEDGSVKIGGKPAKDAVADLLKEKPFLAKPSGSAGSGAPANAGGKPSLSRAAFDALDAGAKTTHIKAGGRVTD